MLRTIGERAGLLTAASSPRELDQITAPTMFCWRTGDPFLTTAQARPSIGMIPGAVLRDVPGGHGPWLEDPAGCGKLATGHFTATGFAPACSPT